MCPAEVHRSNSMEELGNLQLVTSPNEVSLLPGRGAAVYYEGLACDVGGGWRGEEDHDSFEVLGVAETVERDALGILSSNFSIRPPLIRVGNSLGLWR